MNNCAPYLGPAQARVLLTLSLEPRRTNEITDDSDINAGATATHILGLLAKKKLACRVKHGYWALAPGHHVDEALDVAFSKVHGTAQP